MDSLSTNNTGHILAIDAGGTYFKSAIVSREGMILEGSEFKVRVDSDSDSEHILGVYEEVVRHARTVSEAAHTNFQGIGISTPGPFDYQKGISLMKHKFKSLYGIPLREEIIRRCSLDELPIGFVHDANSFLLGEYWKGAAEGYQNAAAITIGTGAGFAVIRDGRLMTNETGGPLYSIYKLPLNGGILEDSVSRRGIIALYKRLSGRTDDFDVIDIEHFALQNGDQAAYETFAETGRIIAENLAPILSELGIECFVLGGQIAKGYPLMAGEMEKGLRRVASLKKVGMGHKIDFSALLGAAWGTMKQLDIPV